MAIVRQTGYIENYEFVESAEKQTHDKHFSDNNKYIRQIETGAIYETAIDVLPCQYTYEETDEDIEAHDV